MKKRLAGALLWLLGLVGMYLGSVWAAYATGATGSDCWALGPLILLFAVALGLLGVLILGLVNRIRNG